MLCSVSLIVGSDRKRFTFVGLKWKICLLKHIASGGFGRLLLAVCLVCRGITSAHFLFKIVYIFCLKQSTAFLLLGLDYLGLRNGSELNRVSTLGRKGLTLHNSCDQGEVSWYYLLR